jgi:hypothetical protein
MQATQAPIDAESRAEAPYHPDDSNNDLHPDKLATKLVGRQCMGSEVERWTRDHFGLFLFLLFSSSLV